MTMIPAVCGNCGSVFPSGIVLTNVRGAILRNNWSQCPNCRQMAKVPDGVYDAIGNTLKVLHDTNGSKETLDRLLKALGKIADNPTEDVRAILRDAEVPNSADIASTAPNDPKQKILWASIIGGMLIYLTHTLPEGALSWIQLIDQLQELFGKS